MQYISNRSSFIELKGLIREIEIEAGTPQGGILSVMLWNIVFDMLLRKFNRTRVKAIGFADDGDLLIHGKDLDRMF